MAHHYLITLWGKTQTYDYLVIKILISYKKLISIYKIKRLDET